MTLILSLDDDPTILFLIAMTLEMAGFERLASDNNDEALSILRSQPIDLLTQDIMRPQMSGIDFYQIMKSDENLRHIPVLFVSAGVRPEFAAECRSVYGDDYLTKPFTLESLVTNVAKVLRRHGKHIPTADEQAARYEQIRAKHMVSSGWTQEKLHKVWKRFSGWLNEDGAPDG